MLSSRQIRRAQRAVILAGLASAVYYISVFRPLAHRAESRDLPLRGAWKQLAAAGIRSNQDQQLNLAEIAKNLNEVKSSVETVENAAKKIRSSIVADANLRQRMSEPFQLVDFQIEELLRIEELGRLARQNNVEIAPSIFSSFPEYRADREEPEVLWGQLAFVHQLLETSTHCKVGMIEKIQLPPYIGHRRSTDAAPFLYEIPIDVDLVGSMEALSKLLIALPLRVEQMKAANLPEVSATKPSLFIQRILLVKNSPQDPDEVHLQLRVCGFILKDW